MSDSMVKHFVTFYSPGMFVAEQTTKEIESWDVAEACKMASRITERYGAVPYAFMFVTMAREEGEWEPKRTAQSPMHFINCKVETLDEVEARNAPSEETLRWNMRANGYNRVARSVTGWGWAQPVRDCDIVIPPGEMIDQAIKAHSMGGV